MKICTKCQKEKENSEFSYNSKTKDNLQTACKQCAKEYRKVNKERLNKYDKERYIQNVDKFKERVKLYRENNRETYLERGRAYSKKKAKELRDELLVEYGGKCGCCGEKMQEFLTIDHINNDGAEHRKTIGSGIKMYRWLKANNYPKDNYELLCFNCNCAKGIYGKCPHKFKAIREKL